MFSFIKKRFNQITELTHESNSDDLIYHFKNMSCKRLNDFNNAIKFFKRYRKW